MIATALPPERKLIQGEVSIYPIAPCLMKNVTLSICLLVFTLPNMSYACSMEDFADTWNYQFDQFSATGEWRPDGTLFDPASGEVEPDIRWATSSTGYAEIDTFCGIATATGTINQQCTLVTGSSYDWDNIAEVNDPPNCVLSNPQPFTLTRTIPTPPPPVSSPDISSMMSLLLDEDS